MYSSPVTSADSRGKFINGRNEHIAPAFQHTLYIQFRNDVDEQFQQWLFPLVWRHYARSLLLLELAFMSYYTNVVCG